MKILFLHTDSFGGFGGIAKFNRDLLNALCSHSEVEAVVALPRLIPEELERMPQKLTFLANGVGGKSRYIVASRMAALSHGAFDLVICGHINLLPVAKLCNLRGIAKTLLIIHGIDAWQPSSSRLVNKLAKNVDAFIAVSNFTREKFCQWTDLHEKKWFILPNCIEFERFEPGPKDQKLLARYNLIGKKIMMTLGRMSADERYKGFDEVLEVLPKLAIEIPEIAYLVVGDGSDRRRLEQKARDLGIDDRVVFTGRIDEAEKAGHYRLADTFVMPGRGEGFGIVYLEALACGIPVIGSKLDGSKDALLSGELGAIVNPDVPGEIIVAIRNALESPKGVPENLKHFTFASYRQRVSGLLGEIFRLEITKQ